MKKKLIILGIAAMVIAGVGLATADTEGMGPAPNSGDCIPDGSGFESPNGQNNGPGPAPNAGDGVSDSPGWE